VELGRDPASLHCSIAIQVCCGSTRGEVRERLAVTQQNPADFAARGIAGSPAEVAERIAAYEHVGAKRCYLAVADLTDIAQLELIAREVMPYV
jgi:alkanesulfonate monooxygenase SsuD/methylene tetrahydromethanopterin reductase-like flavin-dependent oxidoreductase (luciferase family)